MTLVASAFFTRMPSEISVQDEAAFFTALKVGNNTFKKTAPGRFAQLDAALVRNLADAKPRIGEALDIGISSGMTTLELNAALVAAGHSLRLTGTDLSLKAFIVPVAKGCRALIDGAGHILQYDLFGIPVRPWRRRLDYFSGMIAVRACLNRTCAPRARRSLAANRVLRRVDLVSPKLLQRCDIAVEQDDITVENPAFGGRFDFVRAANVLNRDYFDEPTLRRALSHVVSYLAGPGALLLVARTLGRDEHHGTLFEMTEQGHRFRIIEQYGDGSEVEGLVLEMGTLNCSHLELR